MRVEERFEVAAPAARVWAVLADLARWPEWTPSMSAVEPQADPSLQEGAAVRIKQPGFPAIEWRITAVDDGRSFTWEAHRPGLRSVAVHTVEPIAGDRSAVTLAIEQTGLLAPVFALLTGRRTRRYVAMEAEGLRARCGESAE
jgi:uncharacterized protein YndB with AHSA1/START domain